MTQHTSYLLVSRASRYALAVLFSFGVFLRYPAQFKQRHQSQNNMSRTPTNINQKTSIKLGSDLPSNSQFKSISQLSYQPQRFIEHDIEILDPYKSHTTLTWIGGGNKDHYARTNITTDPFPGRMCHL